MFVLSRDVIAGPLLDPDSRSGAVVVFEGRVRNTNEGKAVRRLEYEAYDELAVAEGDRILMAAKDRFPILEAACMHRVGLLELGEVAIKVEVAAGHRREAFRACEWIVDEIKRAVPIWKKEHYEDGDSGWLKSDPSSIEIENERCTRPIDS